MIVSGWRGEVVKGVTAKDHSQHPWRDLPFL